MPRDGGEVPHLKAVRLREAGCVGYTPGREGPLERPREERAPRGLERDAQRVRHRVDRDVEAALDLAHRHYALDNHGACVVERDLDAEAVARIPHRKLGSHAKPRGHGRLTEDEVEQVAGLGPGDGSVRACAGGAELDVVPRGATRRHLAEVLEVLTRRRVEERGLDDAAREAAETGEDVAGVVGRVVVVVTLGVRGTATVAGVNTCVHCGVLGARVLSDRASVLRFARGEAGVGQLTSDEAPVDAWVEMNGAVMRAARSLRIPTPGSARKLRVGVLAKIETAVTVSHGLC